MGTAKVRHKLAGGFVLSLSIALASTGPRFVPAFPSLLRGLFSFMGVKVFPWTLLCSWLHSKDTLSLPLHSCKLQFTWRILLPTQEKAPWLMTDDSQSRFTMRCHLGELVIIGICFFTVRPKGVSRSPTQVEGFLWRFYGHPTNCPHPLWVSLRVQNPLRIYAWDIAGCSFVNQTLCSMSWIVRKV